MKLRAMRRFLKDFPLLAAVLLRDGKCEWTPAKLEITARRADLPTARGGFLDILEEGTFPHEGIDEVWVAWEQAPDVMRDEGKIGITKVEPIFQSAEEARFCNHLVASILSGTIPEYPPKTWITYIVILEKGPEGM